MTLYTHHNVSPPCAVYDVDTKQLIDCVVSITTVAGVVVCHHKPLRLNAHGEIDTFTLRYRSIYPIFAGYPYPCLFHCYGALQ